MKKRLRRVLVIVLGLSAVGLIYALVCRWLGFGLPCLFRTVTGWQCPGCGVSRMCLCLLKGDMQGAYRANPVLLLSLPVLVAVLGDSTVRYVRGGGWRTKGWSTVMTWILVAVLLTYGVLRNIL